MPSDCPQDRLISHLAAHRWSGAEAELTRGATCHPQDLAARVTLWRDTAVRVLHDSHAPARLPAWDWLLAHGAEVPSDECGVLLLSELLRSKPLWSANWLVSHGLELPHDARARPVLQGALARAGVNALEWVRDQGLPLDPPGSESPSLRQAIAVHGLSAMGHVKVLRASGVSCRPWLAAPANEDATALVVLARAHATACANQAEDPDLNRKFVDMWDALVEAGDLPEALGHDGRSALELACATPFQRWHTARTREQRGAQEWGGDPQDRRDRRLRT